MHIKTNIEASTVQFVVISICPLLLVTVNVASAFYYIAGTFICLMLSQLFCVIFNKFLTNGTKVFLTALISCFSVITVEFLLQKYAGKVFIYEAFYIVLSTLVLSSEFIYYKNPATIKHYMLYVLRSFLLFALILTCFAGMKEFLCFGTIYDKKFFEFSGVEFFKTSAFSLMLLATLCFIFDAIVRAIDRKNQKTEVIYQKYVKKVRDEKIFQYDKMRRDKSLKNEIEVNKIGADDADILKKKIAENESIDSVDEVLEEAKEENDNELEEIALAEETASNQEDTIEDNTKKKKKFKEKKKKSKKEK